MVQEATEEGVLTIRPVTVLDCTGDIKIYRREIENIRSTDKKISYVYSFY